MAKKKKITYPIHKMGKRCGYHEHEDGSISVAPHYSSRLEDFALQESALQRLIFVFTSQCHELMIPIEKAREAFWNELKEDYDLDFENFDYSYDGRAGIVSRTPKKRETQP